MRVTPNYYRTFFVCLLSLCLWATSLPAQQQSKNKAQAGLQTEQQPQAKKNIRALNGHYRATAYAQTGITASGEWTHRHIVAADPDILPIGTRIKVRRAGRYSGEYVVADTGAAIQGRRLDIYMPSEVACKKFGTRWVKVQVLELGDGTRDAAKQADQKVKHDVAQELQKQAVGNAATNEDWARNRRSTNPPEH